MNIDLTTNYGGLILRSPIVVGACPLTAQEQFRLAAEACGAGAIVLPSLFDEQIAHWQQSRPALRDPAVKSQAQLQTAEPIWHDSEAYLSIVNRASTQASIPVIASLNGHGGDQWSDYADELEEAGAAGIELNIHCGPSREFEDPRVFESIVVDTVGQINAAVTIPLFVKLTHQYTSVSHLARQLQSGAQGLVLFGRRPDVDICLDDLSLVTRWGLTSAGSIVHSLSTIMQVHGCCPSMPIAASGGIDSADDTIKALMAGADVAMVTSAIYRQGAELIRSLTEGLERFMASKQFRSIAELQMRRPLEFSTDQERANYIKALSARPIAEQSS